MHNELANRLYSNAGNPAVVALVDRRAATVLDVGCGAGDTAALLRARDPHKEIYGITMSTTEAAAAGDHMRACWVGDLELEVPKEAAVRSYDTIIAAHVLEHMRDPGAALSRLVRYLRPGGECIIAVPNVLGWRQRLMFLRGRFEYAETGTMDETHLRFYSYETADRYLLAKTPELRVVHKGVTGSVPLWLLRRHVLPPPMAAAIDAWGCRVRPNLFGSEVLIKAVKDG